VSALLDTFPKEHVLEGMSPRACPEVWVIDATALLFRAYYGMPARLSPAGEHVGAVLGLGHLLRGLLRRAPERVVLVYDAGRFTFRNRIDPRYKANRGEPPPDLAPQFELARQFGAAAGFVALSVPDFEADDLMATLARSAAAAGLRTRLFSVDKDLCQLVRDEAPGVVLEDPRTQATCDAAGVLQRMGVRPSQVVDYMALVGDTSDNVPGVPGVGPKAAQALIAAFGDLDALYDSLGRVAALPLRGAKGLAAKLEAGREAAFLARALVRLHDAVPLGALDLHAHTRWGGPRDDADEFFAALGSPGALRGLRSIASQPRA
jgi:DNA polymerase I